MRHFVTSPVDAPRWTERVGLLTAALPTWLETRRWFADKGRGIVAVELEDALAEEVGQDVVMLAVVRVAFRSGEDARYLVPVAWTDAPGVAEVITNAPTGMVAGAFVEAGDVSWFGRWLIVAMLGAMGRATSDWTFVSDPASREILASAQGVPATVMRAEQSNTSLRYGDVLMVKLVRRLQPGPNPDEEMLRALADVGFDRVPPYVGGASWRAADGQSFPIALAQAFVPNLGDGWSWMQQRMSLLSEDAAISDIGADSPEWLLGRRTGEMHVALAWNAEPSLVPEPVTAASIAEDIHRVQVGAKQTVSLLRDEAAGLPASLRESLPLIVDRLGDASSRADGFHAEAGTYRIRVHGDYHLAQALRTPDQDWVIIDFEGEPARPVAERRQKTSALKDVAAMLRSFAYARGEAERSHLTETAALAVWEAAARQAFLDGYRHAVRAAPVPLVPVDDEAFWDALAAWELDKALYEVAYEVRNRPDWVDLPLRSLLPELRD